MKIIKKKIIKILLLVSILFVSCSNFRFYNHNTKNVSNDFFYTSKSNSHVLNMIPIFPKIRPLNWEIILLPFVQKILCISEIDYDSILLINNIKNNTNGNLHTDQITFALINLISKSGKFIVVKKNQLDYAYSILGLTWKDNLESYSKVIGLGKFLKAKYLLYCTVQGDVKQPSLELQLILINTGEIIWSYKNFIY